MADEKPVAQATELEKNPWEIDWNPVGNKAMEAVNGAAETIKTVVKGVLPWDIDWGAKRPIPQAVEPVQKQSSGFDFNQVFSRLVGAESGGVHETKGGLITSSAGAKGITQLMPATASNPGYGITPIQDNSKSEYLRVGREYLGALVKDFGGDIDKAVAAYNYGPTAVKKLVKSRGENWKEHLPLETKKYLRKILG